VHFAVIWVETPTDVCLERNRLRTASRQVPDQVILKMAEKAERPDSQYHWERTSLVVDGEQNSSYGGNDAEVLETIQQFVLTIPERGDPVPPDTSEKDTMEEARRIQEERMKTRESARHQADQVLRQCVKAVAQINPKKARQANQFRQLIMKEMQATAMEDDAGINQIDLKELFLTKVFEAGEAAGGEQWSKEDKEQLSGKLLQVGEEVSKQSKTIL